MHKSLTALACLFLLGCGDADNATDTSDVPVSGLSVPQEELPTQLIDLIRDLEKLPALSSGTEFQTVLADHGLRREPDHFKDNAHYWYFDRDFKSGTDPAKRIYRIAIGYSPGPNDEISFHWASVIRDRAVESSHEDLWEVNWLESAGQNAQTPNKR